MDFNFKKTFVPFFTKYPMTWFLAATVEIILFIWLFISPFDDGFDYYRIYTMAMIPFFTLAVTVVWRYAVMPNSAFFLIMFVDLAIQGMLSMPTEMTSILGPVPKYSLSGHTSASSSIVAGQIAFALLAAAMLYLYCRRNQHRVHA